VKFKIGILFGMLSLCLLPLIAQEQPPDINCEVFPTDNIWNTRIDDLPVHPLSDTFIETIGADVELHPDFGSGFWPEDSESPIGIPYTTVDSSQPLVDIVFSDYGDESDPGPYPIPPDAPIEGGIDGDGDRHVLVVEEDNCMLYELYYAFPQQGGHWVAASSAVYDLTGYDLRPADWTSADAAGLPILPGLVRYEEIEAGEINHAIRFTLEETRRAYVWPARHYASDIEDEAYPPMGQRFRLRADFDMSDFDPTVQIILRAMQEYGIILADNGSSMFISGAPDPRWDNDVLVPEFRRITAGDFEAVDVCPLMFEPDSAQVNPDADSDADCVTVGD
jgi:hypothetical protein